MILFLIFHRLWKVEGGIEPLTCTSENKTDDYMFCKNFNVRKCTDRTVYCSFPPKPTHQEKIEIKVNPEGSKYEDSNGMIF